MAAFQLLTTLVLCILLSVTNARPVSAGEGKAGADNTTVVVQRKPAFETLGSQYWDFLIESLPTIKVYLHRLDNCIQVVKERRVIEKTKLYIAESGEDLAASQIELCKVSVMFYEEQRAKELKAAEDEQNNDRDAEVGDELSLQQLKETYDTLVKGSFNSSPDEERGNALGLQQDHGSIAADPFSIKLTYEDSDASSHSSESTSDETTTGSNGGHQYVSSTTAVPQPSVQVDVSSTTAAPQPTVQVDVSSTTAAPQPTVQADVSSTAAAPQPTVQADVSSTTAAPQPSVQADVSSTTAAPQPTVQADVSSTTAAPQPTVQADVSSTTAAPQPTVQADLPSKTAVPPPTVQADLPSKTAVPPPTNEDDKSVHLQERLLEELVKQLTQQSESKTK